MEWGVQAELLLGAASRWACTVYFVDSLESLQHFHWPGQTEH
jgi:hypothetical protein